MTISVAMCTWNGARFVDAQLQSIAAQTTPPSELVVSDDGSSDDTLDRVRAFATVAPFPVRIHQNQQRLGSTKNFEQAIRHCTGDVIALADQDDVWHPEKLGRITRLFVADSETALVFTDARLIDESGKVGSKSLWHHLGFRPPALEQFRRGKAFDHLVVRNVVTGATMAFRSQFRNEVLPIPAAAAIVHDRWIAIIVAAISRLQPLDEPLIDYRQHRSQQIGAGREVGGVRHWIEMSAQTGSADFDSWGTQLSLVRDRLIALGDRVPAERIVALEGRIRHLAIRARMPGQGLARIPFVLSELFSLRYHRYSNHFWSALKDLAGVGEAIR